MADRIILLIRGDETRAQRIIEAFGERTGLTGRSVSGGTEFALGADDHRIQVVQTLTDIDRTWSDHVALGDPDAAA